MREQPFWAHSARGRQNDSDSRSGWQLLADHLVSVASLAREFAVEARSGDPAFAEQAAVCGLLHDYGKYTDCFQRRITTGLGRCEHAIHGAQLAVLAEDSRPVRPYLMPAAFAIAGHHGGLPDSESLRGRLKFEKHRAESDAIRTRAREDCYSVGGLFDGWQTQVATSPPVDTAHLDLWTRMLFSCLVDADRLDTAGRKPGSEALMAGIRLAALLDYVEDLQKKASTGGITELRKGILDDCLSAVYAAEQK